jgi:hypothetical protein
MSIRSSLALSSQLLKGCIQKKNIQQNLNISLAPEEKNHDKNNDLQQLSLQTPNEDYQVVEGDVQFPKS